MPKISYRQLQALSAVIAAGTVNKAAVNMAISQPALSQLISNLEHASGLILFQRERNRLLPTEEAHMLNEYAEEIFSGISAVENISDDIRNRRLGRVVIAAVPSVSGTLLPEILAPYLADRPNVDVSFRTASSRTVVNWISRRHCDLGICEGLPGGHPEIEVLHRIRTPLVCVLPTGDPLSDLATISARDLQGRRLILFSAPSALRGRLEEVLAAQKVDFEKHLDGSIGETICSLVAAGLGVGFANPFTSTEFEAQKKVIVRPFKPDICFETIICAPKGAERSLVAQDFLGLLSARLDKYEAQ